MLQVSSLSSQSQSVSSNEKIKQKILESFEIDLKKTKSPIEVGLRVLEKRQTFPDSMKILYLNFLTDLQENHFEDFCFRFSGGDDANEIYESTVEKNKEFEEEGKDLYLYAKKDDRILGELNYSKLPAEKNRGEACAEIDLIIHPTIQKFGLGRALLNAALTAARCDGCKSAIQSVDNQNKRQIERLSKSESEWKEIEKVGKIKLYHKNL